jgi:hypothetical protein
MISDHAGLDTPHPTSLREATFSLKGRRKNAPSLLPLREKVSPKATDEGCSSEKRRMQ